MPRCCKSVLNSLFIINIFINKTYFFYFELQALSNKLDIDDALTREILRVRFLDE